MDLLKEIKKGLGLSEDTGTDETIKQKIEVIKAYADFNDNDLNNPLAIGCIVVGVTDIWETDAGKIKFSEGFHMLLEMFRVSKLRSAKDEQNG